MLHLVCGFKKELACSGHCMWLEEGVPYIQAMLNYTILQMFQHEPYVQML